MKGPKTSNTLDISGTTWNEKSSFNNSNLNGTMGTLPES